MTATAEKKVKKAEGHARPVLTHDELREEEAALIKKYGSHIVVGSLKNADQNEKSPHYRKRTVEIRCTYPGCKEKRHIATSDLAQVKMCAEHVRLSRLERRKAMRAAKPAAKRKHAK